MMGSPFFLPVTLSGTQIYFNFPIGVYEGFLNYTIRKSHSFKGHSFLLQLLRSGFMDLFYALRNIILGDIT